MFQKLVKIYADKISKILAAVIVFIIIIYYAITISTANNMNKQMVIVSEHPYTVVVAIGDIKAHLTLLRALPERLAFSQSEEMLNGIRTHYETIDTSMNSLIGVLADRYLADTESVPAMQETYQELNEAQIKLMVLAQEHNISSSEIADYYNKEIIPKLDVLDGLATTITEGAGRKLGEYSSLVNSSKNTMLIMGSVLSSVVLVSILFYLYILKIKYKVEEEMYGVRAELEIEQRANAAKSQFLFNMSHDIRTPMNAIIGLTAIAAMDIDKKDKVKDCLKKISSSSRQLLGLINDVLDMSRIESGKVALNEEPFSLPELIDEFITITLPQANEKGLQMEINASDLTHEKVIGDIVQIKRIMVNIIGNSLKFTPAGGKILMTIHELPMTTKGYGNYQFIMRDTGIGMSESFVKKLFMPFERAETSTKSKVEGTGLGMAITKNIVDMMAGEIKVDSKIGVGTTFTIGLPIKLQASEEETCNNEQLHDLRSLVVDDDETACEHTVRLIQEIGMSCDGVLTGVEAVDKTKNAHEINKDYHVVIIDWKMPDMDGLETTRQIRKIVGNELPIIVLTAYDWTDIKDEAKAAGVNAFLSKPIFKSRLYHIIRDLTVGDASQDEKLIEEDSEKTFTGRVLLVEDNEINMEIAEDFIGYFGVTTEQAWDGVEAVARIKEVGLEYYDLVFMDIQMPQMDGYEATRQIRKFESETSTTHLPIIAMSANAFIEEINKGYECGMDNYITKPVEMEKLSSVLETFLKAAS